MDPILQILSDLKRYANAKEDEVVSLQGCIREQSDTLILLQREREVQISKIAELEGRIMCMSEELMRDTING